VRVNVLWLWEADVGAAFVIDGDERVGRGEPKPAEGGADTMQDVGLGLGGVAGVVGKVGRCEESAAGVSPPEAANCGSDVLGTEAWSIDACGLGFGISKQGVWGSADGLRSCIAIESSGTLCVNRVLLDKLWVDRETRDER
jgi:hypothetical protein